MIVLDYSPVIKKMRLWHDTMSLTPEGKFRKDGETPYWTHPLSIFQSMQKAGIEDPTILIPALFHDVLEDTKVTIEEIHEVLIEFFKPLHKLSEHVFADVEVTMQAIYDMTDNCIKFDLKRTSRDQKNKLDRRKRKDIACIHFAKYSSVRGIIVKIFDRLDNIKDLKTSTDSADFKVKYVLESMDLVKALREGLDRTRSVYAYCSTPLIVAVSQAKGVLDKLDTILPPSLEEAKAKRDAG